MRPRLAICMGVSGAGKTSLARPLAQRLGWQFVEADDHHPRENRERMASGQPLEDRHRGPWMDALCTHLCSEAQQGRSCVMAHSGLRRAHRDRLRGLGFDTRFLHLEGARDTIAQRLAARPDHFMPASLLDSQFAALEPTDHEEDVMSLDLDQPLEYLLDLAEQALRTETAS